MGGNGLKKKKKKKKKTILKNPLPSFEDKYIPK